MCQSVVIVVVVKYLEDRESGQRRRKRKPIIEKPIGQILLYSKRKGRQRQAWLGASLLDGILLEASTPVHASLKNDVRTYTLSLLMDRDLEEEMQPLSLVYRTTYTTTWGSLLVAEK